MEWSQYLADFFAGLFLTNALPHLVNGISGNRFPTIFSKPRGIGLSSPTTNVIWGCVNVNIAYACLRHSNLAIQDRWSFYSFFLALILAGLGLGRRFQKKHKEEPQAQADIIKE